MSADGRILAPGEWGEVVARGDMIINCYDDDAGADDIAFRDGWFHTGDEGRFDGDG